MSSNLQMLQIEVKALAEAALDALQTINAAIDAEKPIRDVTLRVRSRSRYGESHLVTVHSGVLRCSCESATFRPDRGVCAHAQSKIDSGEVDARAVWGGGLHGLNA